MSKFLYTLAPGKPLSQNGIHLRPPVGIGSASRDRLSLFFPLWDQVDLKINRAATSQVEDKQMGTIWDGLFVLVSLLLGFTLTLAISRFAERRSVLVEEAISIGTTYLRASTLPQPYRDHSRQLHREYVDTRLELANTGDDARRFNETLTRARRLQEDLWLDAATVAQNDRTAVTATYLNSLNETIDLHEKRLAALENRVPHAVWLLIISTSLIAVFTRGSTLTARFWLTLILLPTTIALVVALIGDLDTPGRGLIRLDQRAMQRLKADVSGETAK
jgi:hypothetical protein